MPTDFEQSLRDALQVNGNASSDFDLNPEIQLPANRVLRPAAVLVGIDEKRQSVLLTKRSPKLKHHPGQIAFPGGKKDDGDKDLVATALREAMEEISLPQNAVNVVGTLPSHETVTGFKVSPIVGLIKENIDLFPELGEVSEIFDVPFEFLADRRNFKIQSRQWNGKERHYFSIPHGPYYIWGATARILRNLAERVAL